MSIDAFSDSWAWSISTLTEILAEGHGIYCSVWAGDLDTPHQNLRGGEVGQ